MNRSRRGTPDFLLLLLTFILVGFGLVMVFSASSMTSAYKFNDAWYFTKKQIMWVTLGTVLMFVCMNIAFDKLKKLFIPFFFAIVGMLVFVLFGHKVNGARSWFGVGSLGIQPAEFAKLAVILYLGALISKKGEKFRDFKKGLFPSLVIVGFVGMLIMLQPDLGTCFIVLVCALIVIVVGGANLKHVFALGMVALVIGSVALSIYLLKNEEYGYRIARFTSYMNPWDDPLDTGMQLIQSLYAFGHGGLTGAGLGQSIQKLHYLPEAHNDFIFAIIGEELGFIGSALFIILYLLFLWRGLIVALRCNDSVGTLVGAGIVGMFGIQAFINIGGVTGTIPLTGVTLPFTSYGGSSLLVSMFSVGIMLSISRESSKQDKEAPLEQ